MLIAGLVLFTACAETVTEEVVEEEVVVEEGSYVGTWMRQGTYTNGQLVSSEGATMELTSNTFNSYNSYCANSGSIHVQGSTIVMTVQQSDCPSIITVGSIVTSTFLVSGDQLTLTNTEYGAEVKEIYNRA